MATDNQVSKYIVIAIAGQSNSVGYDESPWTAELENKNPNRIKQLGYHTVDGVDQNLQVIPLGICAHNLQNMSNLPDKYSTPGSFGTTRKGTKGLHLPLAKLLVEVIPEDYGILIVPVAFGGTQLAGGKVLPYNSDLKRPISGNNPAGGTWKVDGGYYQTLRDRVIHALNLNPENKFAGVIWCQGEFDGNKLAAENDKQFKLMVEGLSAAWNAAKDSDGKALSERTPNKTFDKSLWIVHESTGYWEKNGVSPANLIWDNYKKYLGESNYVALPGDVSLTNAVNGGGKRTSAALASHFGNDTFTKVIAPRVANTLLRNKMIYGANGNGFGTADTGKYTKYLTSFNSDSNGFEVNNDNGNIKYVKTVEYGAKAVGPMNTIVFSEDVHTLELSNITGGTVIVLEYTADGDYSGIIFNSDTSGSSVSNYTITRGIGAKNLKTTGGAGATSWDAYNINSGLKVSAYNFSTGKVQIKRDASGKYIFTKGDNKEAWFEYDIKKNAESLVNKGVAADKIKYAIGLGYGWGGAFKNGTTVANILAVNPEDANASTTKKKIVKFAAGEGSGTMADVEIALTSVQTKYTIPDSTFTAPKDKQFKNWLGSNNTEYAAGYEIIFGNEDVFTFTAQYEALPAKPKRYKVVKFNANGGKGTKDDEQVELKDGATVDFTIPENPFTAPDNKQFKTWAEEANGNKPHAAGSKIAFGNEGEFTLFAIWEDITQQPAGSVKLVVDPTSFSGKPGDERIFNVETDNGATVTFTSDNVDIVTADSATKKVVLVAAGQATVKVKAELAGKTASEVSIAITVSEKGTEGGTTTPGETPEEVKPRLTDDEIKNILEKGDFDFKVDLTKIGTEGPIKYRTSLAFIKTYEERNGSTAPFKGLKNLAKDNYNLYYVLVDILEDVVEDDVKFNNIFNIVNKMVAQYKDSSFVYSKLITGLDLWEQLPFGLTEEDVLTYKNLLLVITKLADPTTRDANKADLKIDELLDPAKVRLLPELINKIKTYYGF